MTKQEAEAFVARNPRMFEAIEHAKAIADGQQLDIVSLMSYAENAEDALVNLLEVAKALEPPASLWSPH